MLSPKKVKWRKHQKGKMRGKAFRGNSLVFGDYGLQATMCGYISSRQLEAARVALTRRLKRGGNVWIKIFPDKVLTKKPAEVRMGAGKGSPDSWVAVIKPGRIIFELGGVDKTDAVEAFKLAKYKLPLKTKMITKDVVKA